MKYAIKIYQVKKDDELGISFMGYDYVNKKIPNFKKNYQQYYYEVYDYEVELDTDNVNKFALLENIFTKFNINHPDDFRGHSLSVSDIVTIDDITYFCDTIGWIEI